MEVYIRTIVSADRAPALIACCKEAQATVKFEIADLLFDGAISLSDVVIILGRVMGARAQIETLLLKHNSYDDVSFKACVYMMVLRYIPEGFDLAFGEVFDAAWFLLSEAPPKIRASCHC